MHPTPVVLNDFKRQWEDIGADVLSAVERVGQSGWYVLGSAVATFEASLTKTLGAGYAVGCASGLDAIEIALRALGIQPGMRVLTTPLSAFATTLAIVRAGGVPVFVDVDANGNLDLDLAERCLAGRADIAFLVPVHLYGYPLDLERLHALKLRFRLRVVEDCAQAVGARPRNHPIGSVGDLAATSFYPTKNLGALGDGGAVIGADESLIQSCRSLRDYGQSARYVHDRLGLNSRLDELHAAVLDAAMMPRLERWNTRRSEVAKRYREAISNPAVQLLPFDRPDTSSWHLFPVLVAPAQREAFRAHLQRHSVHSAVHYPVLIPEQPALRDVPFEIFGVLACARRIADSEVSLPMHPYLGEIDVEQVIAAVNEWCPV